MAVSKDGLQQRFVILGAGQSRRREESMTSLKGKTLFVSGGSRGIGLAIALRAARDGANVAIAAKTAEPHPKLQGTIYTAAEQVRAAAARRSVELGRRQHADADQRARRSGRPSR